MKVRYTVIIEKGETNYGAYAPDIPGCGTVAGAREEVELLIQEAIEFHLEGLALAGQPIPQPVSDAITVNVTLPTNAAPQPAFAARSDTA
ncbi:MAG: type II toxin-antitoxin system HicB family antitoxin [Thermomicrobiales bacterium]